MKIFLSYFAQKVNRLGFALGWTLLGTHKVEKWNLHLTYQFKVLTTWKRKERTMTYFKWQLSSPIGKGPPGVYPISKELHTVCHTGIQDSKGHNCSRNLTRHGALLQVSHSLKRLTPTAPHKLILPSSQRYRPRSWHNTAQRVIPPQLTVMVRDHNQE